MQEDVVLVVDDEPQIRRVVRNALGTESARVIEAATGRDAIDLAAAERPSIVILDLGLPDVSGLEVCRELRQSRRELEKRLLVPELVVHAEHGVPGGGMRGTTWPYPR